MASWRVTGARTEELRALQAVLDEGTSAMDDLFPLDPPAQSLR